MQSVTWLSAKATELAGTGWQEDVDAFLRNDAGRALCARLDARLAQGIAICPQDPFRALRLTPREAVKVVILGQDPYHGEGQATGLAFAVQPGVKTPPSLRNIFKELQLWGPAKNTDGDLTGWAEQGVLLLNATLTVRAHQAGSHQRRGWEEFTDAAIRVLAEQKEHLVFILWGSYAQKKGAFIDRNKHLVLTSVHPSPLSAYNGFFGNKHFSRTNEYLVAHGETPINW